MVNSEVSADAGGRVTRWRPGALELLVFAAAMMLAALIVWRADAAHQVGERERALHLAQGHAQVLQRNIERMVSLSHALAALVRQGEGTVPNFDAAAAVLYAHNPRVVAMSISPGGVVRHVVPRERNERLLGFDALNDPAQKGAAIFARDTGRLGLAGPMRLAQGGLGFVTRLPIQLPDAGGVSRFWGFANVTILQADLLAGAALDDLRGQGFDFELWKLEPESGRKLRIAGSASRLLDQPVRQSLEVPSGAWNLDLAPVGGWRDFKRLAGQGAFSLLASALLAYFAHMLMAQRLYKTQLEEQVVRRTAEILSTQNQLKSTLDAIRDPIYELGLDGVIHSCSAPADGQLPAPPEEMLGKTVREIMPDAAARTMMEALQVAHADGFSQGEQYSLNLEEGRRWFELSVARKAVGAGAAPRFVVMTRDITGRKSAKQEIRRLAFYDPLTDLPNRRLLQDRLEHALAASVRNKSHGALLLIDLDNFKALNDTMGHDKGDLLLQQVARRLQASVRDSDTVARLGGDEFVVLVDDAGHTQAEAAENATIVASKILEVLDKPFPIAGREHRSSSSIGVSLFGDGTASVEEAFKRSDVAMYQAKAAGRNTLRFFDPAMQAAVEARAALEVDLRQALAQDEFALHFQPQVGPHAEVVGAEALLRWNHPVRGQVPPGEFIPVAEQSGLVIDIGQWVLRTACSQLAAWATD
ncbi:MAG: diguanylate cyclase, partial [Burkholderiaceae bacterium]